MTLIERFHAKQQADSQPRQNEPDMPGVPQGLREYDECIRVCREQLLARVQAAGRQ